MLVLERGLDQSVHLLLPDGGKIVVTPVKFRSGRVRLGIAAPADIKILRNELDVPPAAGKAVTP